jgi:hypothetical protein
MAELRCSGEGSDRAALCRSGQQNCLVRCLNQAQDEVVR